MKKKILAMILSSAMIFGIIPQMAFADTYAQEETQMPTGKEQAKGINITLSKEQRANVDSAAEIAQSGEEKYGVKYNRKSSTDYKGDNWDSYSSNYVYNQLTSDEREFYDALDTICYSFLTNNADAQSDNSGGVTYYYIDGIRTSDLTVDRAEEVYLLFLYTNPQYYFLLPSYAYASFADTVYIYPTIYNDFANGSTRANTTANFLSEVESVESNISALSSVDDKIKYIHDYISTKVEYDYEYYYASESMMEKYDQRDHTQSAYSVICGTTTVCAGYSQAFSLLANGAGIDAISVTSTYHQWNMLRVNDSWYNLDVTWDDSFMDDEYSAYYAAGVAGCGYVYYGKSTANITSSALDSQSNHVVESVWDSIVPEATLDTGSTQSSTGTFVTVTRQAMQPTYTLAYNVSTNKYIITLKGASGSKIYYTTNATAPSVAYAKSKLYKSAFSVSTSKISKVRCMAVKDTYLDSEVISLSTSKVTDTISKTKISSKSAKKNAVTLTLKKITNATGYQVQYSATKSKISSGKKKTSSSRKIKIGSLEENKTYYFRVRTRGKSRAGSTIYSEWSSVVKIKTKKK